MSDDTHQTPEAILDQKDDIIQGEDGKPVTCDCLRTDNATDILHEEDVYSPSYGLNRSPMLI